MAVAVGGQSIETFAHPRLGAAGRVTSGLAPPRPARAIRVKAALAVGDLTAVIVGMAAATWLHHANPGQSVSAAEHLSRIELLSLPVWLALLVHYRLYSSPCISSRLQEFQRLVHAAGASVLAMAAFAYLVQVHVPRAWLAATFVTTVASLTLGRDLARRFFDAQRRRGSLCRHLVIVGANQEGREVAAMLSPAVTAGYEVVGFVDDDMPAGYTVDGVPVLGGVEHTSEIVARSGADGVVIATTSMGLRAASRLACELTSKDIHVELSSGLCDIKPERLTVERLGRLAVLYVEPVRLGGWRGVAKRGFDIGVASVALLVSVPVLLASIVLIKLDSSGPVLFRQQRIGRDGRTFRILKLRTMVVDAEARLMDLRHANEADGPLFKLRDDPRITRVGRWLRQLSIDEIPQLWNVVRGEMSLVGPRPALPDEVDAWPVELRERLQVRPGITGMWQVNGRASASFDDYTRLDLYYVHNWSLLTDLAMLAKTVPTVLSRHGAC